MVRLGCISVVELTFITFEDWEKCINSTQGCPPVFYYYFFCTIYPNNLRQSAFFTDKLENQNNLSRLKAIYVYYLI